jgi:hypothetical protein
MQLNGLILKNILLLTAWDVIDDFENNLSASLNFLCFLSNFVDVLLLFQSVRKNSWELTWKGGSTTLPSPNMTFPVLLWQKSESYSVTS